ncbi:hypothetical protein [Trueperella pyogenes]|uniref:Uncharacterized protein n=1 Tax=Trueperella pyogenes TaxID=1661 RepID=A0ABV3N9L7_9ACTO|nr:hypothetical protein [Trueperella pyogenes]
METWLIIIAATMTIVSATLGAPTWMILTASSITIIATATAIKARATKEQ